jgi:hypothetical protein
MKVLNFIFKHLFGLLSAMILTIQVQAQGINTTTCNESSVFDPYAAFYGITKTVQQARDEAVSAGLTFFGSTQGSIMLASNDETTQTFSTQRTGYTFSSQYRFTVQSANIDLAYFEIVGGERAAFNGPGPSTFGDTPPYSGSNVQVTLGVAQSLAQGTTTPNIGITWTKQGKCFLRFYGYRTFNGQRRMVEYKCREVDFTPTQSGQQPCGSVEARNWSSGAIFNTFTSVSSQQTYVTLSATNASSFNVTNVNTGSSGCYNPPHCNQVLVNLSPGSSVSYNITPVGCSSPTTITRTFYRSNYNSCPWCLTRNNNLDNNKQYVDIKREENEKSYQEIDINLIKDVGKSELSVFPNPASSSLNINPPRVDCYISLVNILGQEVLRSYILSSNSQENIDVSKLQRGIYVLSFKDTQNNVISNQKVVLE